MAQQSILQEQVAIITGAGRGIGKAISLRLASLGAHCLLVARTRETLDSLAREIEKNGGSATACPLDLRDAAAIERLGATIRERWGRADILVNNAGEGRLGKPLHEMEPDQWNALMATNLTAPYLMIRAIAPLMIEAKTGHIINISSLAGRNPLPNGAAYSASKWALNGLTYSLAEELRPYNIRVSVVSPGSVNTGFGGGDGGADERALRKIQPDDIADVIALLVQQRPQSFISEVLVRPTSKS